MEQWICIPFYLLFLSKPYWQTPGFLLAKTTCYFLARWDASTFCETFGYNCAWSWNWFRSFSGRSVFYEYLLEDCWVRNASLNNFLSLVSFSNDSFEVNFILFHLLLLYLRGWMGVQVVSTNLPDDIKNMLLGLQIEWIVEFLHGRKILLTIVS